MSKLPYLTSHGELPPKDLIDQPWTEVSADLMSPWTIKIHGVDLNSHALTAVDTVTTFDEIIHIDDKTPVHVVISFGNEWLARSLHPIWDIQVCLCTILACSCCQWYY